MNFLLSLDKKYILFITIIIFVFFLSLLFFKYFSILKNETIIKTNIISNVDITEPRFAINSSKQKIFVTANEGNFINESKILLKKNVLFESENFSIETEKVVFDRIKQTATSNSNSIFKSKNTKISSEGFNIYDNGNKIKFIGNATIILK